MVTCSPYRSPPQAALNGCSGCALHEAAVQRTPGRASQPLGLTCPLSAAALFASLLVLVEEKETGGACSQYS